jgi:hypothetical protein
VRGLRSRVECLDGLADAGRRISLLERVFVEEEGLRTLEVSYLRRRTGNEALTSLG